MTKITLGDLTRVSDLALEGLNETVWTWLNPDVRYGTVPKRVVRAVEFDLSTVMLAKAIHSLVFGSGQTAFWLGLAGFVLRQTILIDLYGHQDGGWWSSLTSGARRRVAELGTEWSSFDINDITVVFWRSISMPAAED